MDELTIVVAAAAGSNPLERDGMLRRLEDAVSQAINDDAPQGYITNGTTGPTEIRMIICADGLASAATLSLVGDAVTTLMTDPDLLGWGPFSVNVTDEAPDTDRSPDTGVVTDADGLNDPESSFAQLPDPDEAGPRLLADAAHLDNGLDAQWLTHLDVHDPEPDQQAQAVTEAGYVAGALFRAAVVTVDYLFADYDALLDATDRSEAEATVATAKDAPFFVVEDLPDHYRHRYDALFVKRLIVATVDVTRRLTAGWEPLACVAEELAFRLILNEAEAQLDMAGVEVDETWRDVVEDALYEDTDHEVLYDPSLDGVEDDEPLLALTRMVNLAFTEWFTPFNPDRPLPPYLLDMPKEV